MLRMDQVHVIRHKVLLEGQSIRPGRLRWCRDYRKTAIPSRPLFSLILVMLAIEEDYQSVANVLGVSVEV